MNLRENKHFIYFKTFYTNIFDQINAVFHQVMNLGSTTSKET